MVYRWLTSPLIDRFITYFGGKSIASFSKYRSTDPEEIGLSDCKSKKEHILQ